MRNKIWRSEDGSVELRLGRWQDVLTDVAVCGALITDPPFSQSTHTGARTAGGKDYAINYKYLSSDDVTELAESWSPRVQGWCVIHTDTILAPLFRVAFGARGRLGFAPVPVLQPMPRFCGDGPGPSGHYLAVARPRGAPWSKWGSLPGWYSSTRAREKVKGAKPLDLMHRIIGDYSRPGDLIVDPCAGSGTTLIAARMIGRKALGSEADREHYDAAVTRLEKFERLGWATSPQTELLFRAPEPRDPR